MDAQFEGPGPGHKSFVLCNASDAFCQTKTDDLAKRPFYYHHMVTDVART